MNEEPITKGSGNIFADMDFKDPEAWQGKARLAAEIMAAIARRKWTQKEAAAHLGVTQAEISNIRRGQFDRFTLDRLLHYLRRLERDISIQVTTRQDHKEGHLAVHCQ
jgi:predicted XRE-type DNA-binding protein